MNKNIAILTVDLSLAGDGGKGKIVDALARKYKANTIVKYTSGSQCAHNVVADGVHFCFSQFGSGHLAGAKTFLSKHFIINPLNLETEEQCLQSKGVKDNYSKLFVDQRALVTTPFHVALNRLEELSRGKNRHGSCGKGIWQTVKDSLNVPDLSIHISDFCVGTNNLINKLKLLAAYKRAEFVGLVKPDLLPEEEELWAENAWIFEERLIDFHDLAEKYVNFVKKVNLVTSTEQIVNLLQGVSIFEGGQSAGLDADFGFPPYHTATSTTLKNANQILEEVGYEGKVVKVGICRTYATRHGAGPFVTELVASRNSEFVDLCRGHHLHCAEQHNGQNPWQGAWRVGHLDIAALEYGQKIAGKVDYLALTFMDALNPNNQVCGSYKDTRSNHIWTPSEVYLAPELITEKMFNSVPNLVGVSKETIPLLLSDCLKAPVAITSHGTSSKETKFIVDILQ